MTRETRPSTPTHGHDHKAQVLAATDIVELIGRSVALKRSGKGFLGLCPFHQEKTPSFHVNPTKQYFRCFGCKAGGNAIDYVMHRDRIEFIDALKLLAEQAGIELPRYGVSMQQAGERQGLLEATSAACAFFEKMLNERQRGAPAREYLKDRGFNEESIRRFRVGMAPDAWDALLRGLAGKYSQQTLIAAGLVKQRDNGSGCYDTFRNRLIFPIRDENGRIIGFGGRTMPGSNDPAKYLNSPETPLFSKSRCVFGLDLAKQKIIETRTAVVVEGYTDVVMAHQFGVSNVVSVLGTAMTEQHLSLLRRFADRIILLFDSDTAGEVAVDRSVELFLRQPVEIAIATMPPGVDPDEYLLKHGAEQFEKVLAQAVNALDYKWKGLTRQFAENQNDLSGLQKAVERYLDVLAEARGSGPVDSIRWGAALARVARLTGVPQNELYRRFRGRRTKVHRFRRRLNDGLHRQFQGRKTSVGATAQVAASGEPTDESPAESASGPKTAQDRAERWLIGILLAEPQHWPDVQQHVTAEEFMIETHRRLAEMYWQHQRNEGQPEFSHFLTTLPQGLKKLAIELLEECEAMPEPAQKLRGAVDQFIRNREKIEEQKLLAMAHRTTGHEDLDQDPLLQLYQMRKKPDLTRVGPDLRHGA